ncbi:MAG TPA: hypothetical protein VFG73_01370 [Rhodanobacteraceae bacterium]|nr:hypothetical protein [Rhodanobacteraceae bacterium]
MKARAHIICGILFFATLLFDVLALGGAAIEQPAVQAQARLESPLAETYIVLGRSLANWIPGVTSVATALASASFGDAYPAVAANPPTALDTLFADSHGALAPVAKASYWLPLPLLLLWLLLRWKRPRPVHLIGGGR